MADSLNQDIQKVAVMYPNTFADKKKANDGYMDKVREKRDAQSHNVEKVSLQEIK